MQHLQSVSDRSDRLPINLAKVLENPKAYIAGPDSQEVIITYN